MATLQSPEEHPSSVRVTGPNVTEDNLGDIMKGSSPITADDSESRPLRALRAVRRPPACLLSSSLNFVLLQRHNALPVVQCASRWSTHTLRQHRILLLRLFPFLFQLRGTPLKGGVGERGQRRICSFPWVWTSSAHEAPAINLHRTGRGKY